MKPWLLLDCYLDPAGGAEAFLPLMRPHPVEVLRVDAALPASVAPWCGVVITGSPASVCTDPPTWLPGALALLRDALVRSLPVLGVCFGHQLLAEAVAGPGAVRPAAAPEVGWHELRPLGDATLLCGLEPPIRAFFSHEDEVDPAAPGLVAAARTSACPTAVIRVPDRHQWGVQLHVEFDRAEEERLVRLFAARHPELRLDADAVLARAVDPAPLARRLFENFFGSLHRVVSLKT